VLITPLNDLRNLDGVYRQQNGPVGRYWLRSRFAFMSRGQGAELWAVTTSLLPAICPSAWGISIAEMPERADFPSPSRQNVAKTAASFTKVFPRGDFYLTDLVASRLSVTPWKAVTIEKFISFVTAT
jgi:hypothetical protein